LSFCSYNIQHCFICRPSDSTVPTDDIVIPSVYFVRPLDDIVRPTVDFVRPFDDIVRPSLDFV
jgi:hypothetical protein